MYYDRPYRIQKWIVGCNLNEKQEELLKKSMPKVNSKLRLWPAAEMKSELDTLAKEGYRDQVNQPMPHFLDLTLALRAVINITRRQFQNAQISPRPPYHRHCNNRIERDEDYARLCNEILRQNDDTTLSQVFDTGMAQNDTWVSLNADLQVVTKLAVKVLTIGNDDTCDINLANLNAKDLIVAISAAFKD
jgi:hypothetical protein